MNNKKERILVLMSTYNGITYLDEQIQSICSQKGVDTYVLIRDDGSNDGTLSYLEEFVKLNSNVQIFKGSNIGSANSFMDLIREASSSEFEFNYFAFCDQDDVWKEDKLYTAVNVLDKHSHAKPSIYMGAYQMVDSSLNKIPTHLISPRLNLPAALATNSATGCTMVINKPMIDILASKSPHNIIMHDYWAYLVCLSIGGCVYYDENPYILYRQHDHNVIGGRGDSFMKKWIVRLSKLFRSGDCFKSKLASELLRCYSEYMSKENFEFLTAAATCKKISSKYKMLSNPLFRGKTRDNDIQNFALVITGKF